MRSKPSKRETKSAATKSDAAAVTPAPGRSSPGHSTAPASSGDFTHTFELLGATISTTTAHKRARVVLPDGTKKSFESKPAEGNEPGKSGLLQAMDFARADHKRRHHEAETKRLADIEKARQRAAKAGG